MLRAVLLSSNIQLHSLCIIQAYPSISSALIGFQKPPPGCALAVRLLHNRESADSRIFTGLCMVSAGTFPDVQVRDGYPHQIWGEKCCFRCVDVYTIHIKHTMPRLCPSLWLMMIPSASGLRLYFLQSMANSSTAAS